MGRTQIRFSSTVGWALFVVALTGCSEGGDLSFSNEGSDDVSVVANGEASSIDAGGGMVILDGGCTDGDVLVTFPSGRTVTLPGPVCPDHEVVIHDHEEVELRSS